MKDLLRSTLPAVLAALLPGPAALAQGVPGAVSYWNFNTGTGNDDIGNRDAVVSGAVPTADRFGQPGQAFLLGGDPEHLEVPYDPIFTPGDSSISYSLWFRSDTQSPLAFEQLLCWYRCGANPLCAQGDGALVHVALDSLGRVLFEVRDAPNNLLSLNTDPLLDLRDGAWHHVVAMLDRSTDQAVLYLDGQLAGTQSGVLDILDDGGHAIPLSFGRRFRQGWDVPGSYFQGALDDISYYRRVLTSTEVLQLFDYGLAVREAAGTDLLFTLQPNPADGPVQVLWHAAAGGRLEVYDPAGRVVRQERTPAAVGMPWTLDLSGLPQGTYVVRATGADGRRAAARLVLR